LLIVIPAFTNYSKTCCGWPPIC